MQVKMTSLPLTLLAMIAVTLFLTGERLAAQEKLLFTFNSGHPGGVIFDASGNLYGTTYSGGIQADRATVFELSPLSEGGWSEKILHVFARNGSEFSDLAFDALGNLYGTEINSGGLRAGSVFRLAPISGGQWVESLVYDFNTSASSGHTPYGGVLPDAAGNLYGATNGGGIDQCGVVYKLTPSGAGTWTKAVLHAFVASTSDGCNPSAHLSMDATGNIYGTTDFGGTQNLGTVFELSPQASGQWK